MLILILVRSTQLRILRRPQPVAAADVIAGDDAIRSRALHVLAGGGAALILCCVAAQLTALHTTPGIGPGNLIIVLQAVGLVGIALGWNVGTWAFRVRRKPVGQAGIS